jgi:hypothetical protein
VLAGSSVKHGVKSPPSLARAAHLRPCSSTGIGCISERADCIELDNVTACSQLQKVARQLYSLHDHDLFQGAHIFERWRPNLARVPGFFASHLMIQLDDSVNVVGPSQAQPQTRIRQQDTTGSGGGGRTGISAPASITIRTQSCERVRRDGCDMVATPSDSTVLLVWSVLVRA